MEDDVESEVLDDLMNSIILNSSLNHPGLSRNTKEYSDKNVQTETVYQERPKDCKIRDCKNAVKTTYMNLSVKCNMSAEISRVALQTVCKNLYDHNYFLSKDEAIERDPSLSEYKQDNPPSNKRQKLDLPKKQVPKSLNEYKPYKNVLPSAKAINDYKLTLAIQTEKEAATTLYNMPDDVKSTFHFGSTQRSKIDGKWPCLILIFTNNLRFSLRPLFFAYEDRENIVRLIVETYIRLALTITSTEQAVSARDLCEKTTAITADSVSKNLKMRMESETY